ncbi:MAG TPA: histidine--tRNA ligase [Pyrinomonadaceae bacterium]|nr:histidine--tRNA ligase [Pyrinomonadaceae bacterium]
MSKTQPARGMRDFLPADIRKREYVINIVKEVYESYGFEPLETPAVENLETLTGKYGEEGNQLIYKILKRGEHEKTGEADLALRYDLTVPLARVVANYRNDLPKFFKRYQIQPVWRADRPARGRYREFYQCDVDAIGSISVVVEAELCIAVTEILQKLGFEDFIIRINHREILRDLLLVSNIGEIQQTDALIAIDKLDKIGTDGVLKEFEQRGISQNSGKKILAFLAGIAKLENNNEIYVELEKFIGRDAFGANELRRIIEISKNSHIKLDPSLARGLSYYTGAIFEINVPDLAGSLAGGGRYDGLIGMFGKEQIPACGFSIGLERILVVMEERGMFPKELTDSSADVLVTVWNGQTIDESLKLAGELREEKLRVLVYPEADKLGKQFKYAAQINVPFVCVLGENELAENKVTLKNMRTGEQEIITREKISEKVKNQT